MTLFYLYFYYFISILLFFLLRKKEGGSIWIFISGDELPCLESAFLLVRVCLLLEQAAAKKGIKWTTNISQKRLRFLCSRRLVGAPRVVCCGIYVASGAISQEGRFASSACCDSRGPPSGIGDCRGLHPRIASSIPYIASRHLYGPPRKEEGREKRGL